MAIKKYHVSANLFDIGKWLTDRGVSYTIVDGKYEFNTDISLNNNVYYFANDNISVSISGLIEAVTVTSPFITLVNKNGGNAKTTALSPTTIKSENILCAGLKFNWNTGGKVRLSNIMLNTGSTALPYEPYGNTWNTIPYRKYGTETDTITTLPKTIIGDGQSASAVIKGNMQQSGTPTPSAPIYPTECGDKTANLVESQILNANIAANGQIINFSPQNTYNMCIAKVEEGETYCFYNRTGPYGLYANYPAFNSSAIDGTRHFESTITIPNGANYIAVRADYDVNIMVVKGTTPPTSYEPYGVKIPISSANTTTPVYLGEVESSRRIKKLVLTGQEDWAHSYSAPNRFYRLIYSISNTVDCYCSHFIRGDITNDTTDIGYMIVQNSAIRFRPDLTIYSDVTAWKQYLADQYSAGTPVTVWYVLATPTTGIVNEPIRKIGDYADTVSGISIPTTTGADSFDVLTTLKPSEVSLTYHGWHEHSDTKFTT